MAEIIRFPQRVSPRDEALNRLAGKLAAHMTVVFFERKILHIPVQLYINDMLGNLVHDGFDYDEGILNQMGEDPEVLGRFERMFIRILVECGHIPESTP